MMKLMTSVEMKGNEECLCSYLYNMMKSMKSVETKLHVKSNNNLGCVWLREYVATGP